MIYMQFQRCIRMKEKIRVDNFLLLKSLSDCNLVHYIFFGLLWLHYSAIPSKLPWMALPHIPGLITAKYSKEKSAHSPRFLCSHSIDDFMTSKNFTTLQTWQLTNVCQLLKSPLDSTHISPCLLNIFFSTHHNWIKSTHFLSYFSFHIFPHLR